jgi:glycosyltransferase involved in cell wall biosynthesis
MSHLLAYLAKGCEVALLTFEGADAVSFYPMPKSIAYNKGDKLGGSGLRRLSRILSRPRLIRQTVDRLSPDVVVSFTDTTNITALLACLGRGVPIIVSERIDPSQHEIGWLRNLLRAGTYPLARLIVVPSRRIANYFPTTLQPKIRIIGNPIPAPAILARVGESSGRKRVIAVGRHEPQKGFDFLLDAFGLIASDHPDWDLVIIGDGPERCRLERRVQELHLKERIILRGIVSDVSQEFAESHLMAFPSRYEGFPNALAEGLAAGLPAVAYKGVSGVEELIIHEQTGLLVDQSEGATGFASAMAGLFTNGKRRAELGEAARRHVRRWAPDRVFSLWEDALKKAVG